MGYIGFRDSCPNNGDPNGKHEKQMEGPGALKGDYWVYIGGIWGIRGEHIGFRDHVRIIEDHMEKEKRQPEMETDVGISGVYGYMEGQGDLVSRLTLGIFGVTL